MFKILLFYEKNEIVKGILGALRIEDEVEVYLSFMEYLIETDRMVQVMHFMKNYQELFFHNLTRIYSSLLFNLSSYTDKTVREKGCGIQYLEEKFYLIQLMLPYLDLDQASKFLKIIKLLFMHAASGEEINPFKIKSQSLFSKSNNP